MAPRTRKIRHDEETRKKIKASQLINRLTKHALGLIEMTASQVRAADILLKKTLPDLQSTEVSVVDERTEAHEFSDAELANIAAGRSTGASGSKKGSGKPDQVH